MPKRRYTKAEVDAYYENEVRRNIQGRHFFEEDLPENVRQLPVNPMTIEEFYGDTPSS